MLRSSPLIWQRISSNSPLPMQIGVLPCDVNVQSCARKHCSCERGNEFKEHQHKRLLDSNDEVERRGVAPSTNEADLSESSISSLTRRRRSPAIARTVC